jgi:collagenase-like PrtC family protease
MKLTIPFNGQEDLIPQLAGYPDVLEVYGKLTSDFVGGGKHSFQTPSITKSKLAYNVKIAHKQGLGFNYLLNSSCLNNAELTIKGQRKIAQLMDWLVDIGVDSVTVTIPYLLELIKKRYPSLKVYVSVLAGVNSLRRAKFWESMGADRITLLNVDVNRNFPLLVQIKNNVKCQLSLILNANCLYECPVYVYHGITTSHASQSGHSSKGFVIDYCRIVCRYRQITEPVNFIKSSWIRPEDVACYEKIGINCFKIIDRGMSTQTILSIVEAYVKRDYSGNLLDLFPDPTKSLSFRKNNLFPKIRYFLRPFTVNVFKLREFAGLFPNPVYIDNKQLNGFLDNIITKECGRILCEDCGYCNQVAAKVVKIDNSLYKTMVDNYKKCLDNLISGGLFKYP